MRKGKKAILVLAAAVFVTSQAQTVPAFAAANDKLGAITLESTIRPMWVDTDQAIPDISKVGREITASAFISADRSISTRGTLYLEEYNSRGGWKVVRSWSIGGNGTIVKSGTYTGKSGATYVSLQDMAVDTMARAQDAGVIVPYHVVVTRSIGK